MAATAKQEKTVLFPKWERKERTYLLKSDATPVSESLQSRHTKYNELQYFDEEAGYPRSLRYVTNQTTFFEDEQVEPYVLGAIIFDDGKLVVRAKDTVLQQFLAAHPHNLANGGSKFYEFDPEAAAQEDLKKETMAFEAMETFFSLGIEELEPIARVLIGNTIDRMASNELKRDLLIKVKQDPEEFLKLANNSDIKMKNLTIRLVDANIIKFKEDGQTVVWAKNGKEIVKVPFSANVQDMFAKYLKTDEGVLLQESLISKLG